jgi:hypothetical protein
MFPFIVHLALFPPSIVALHIQRVEVSFQQLAGVPMASLIFFLEMMNWMDVSHVGTCISSRSFTTYLLNSSLIIVS